MRYVPMLGVLVFLVACVILMAGEGRRKVELARNMAITLGILFLLVIMFGFVARQFVEP